MAKDKTEEMVYTDGSGEKVKIAYSQVLERKLVEKVSQLTIISGVLATLAVIGLIFGLYVYLKLDQAGILTVIAQS